MLFFFNEKEGDLSKWLNLITMGRERGSQQTPKSDYVIFTQPIMMNHAFHEIEIYNQHLVQLLSFLHLLLSHVVVVVVYSVSYVNLSD